MDQLIVFTDNLHEKNAISCTAFQLFSEEEPFLAAFYSLDVSYKS